MEAHRLPAAGTKVIEERRVRWAPCACQLGFDPEGHPCHRKCGDDACKRDQILEQPALDDHKHDGADEEQRRRRKRAGARDSPAANAVPRRTDGRTKQASTSCLG